MVFYFSYYFNTYFKEKDPNNSFLVNSNSNVKSPEKNFNPEFLFNATNALIYGEKILKLHHGSFYHDCFFYISERKLHHLQWISFKKKFYESRINLLKVSLIHDITSFDFHKSDKSNVFLYIVYSNLANKKKKLTLKFPSFQRKNLFWQGILFFMKESNHLQRNRTHFDLMASGFICSGSNEKEMNFIEMIRFLKDRQIFIEEEELKTVMAKLNFDFDFRKTFFFNKNLFKKILGELVDYNEFIQIFSNYCKNWLEGNKKPDYFMSLDELKKFFLIEQNENLDEIYLKKLLKTKSINLNKPQEVNNDKISLTKLKSILFSMNNQIFDVKKMAIYQVMLLNFLVFQLSYYFYSINLEHEPSFDRLLY